MVEYLTHVLSAKALRLHLLGVVHFALGDITVVKLVPLGSAVRLSDIFLINFSWEMILMILPVQNVRIVMSPAGLARVDHYAGQLVLGAHFFHLTSVSRWVITLNDFSL
jgi:hypothetical protein